MHKTLRHKAYKKIKGRILSLEWKPGESLSDYQISKELGIGRTPVREALLMLEHERLIQCKGKLGFLVKKLSRKDAEDYLAIRLALETFAVPSIIEGATTPILTKLEECIENSINALRQNDLRRLAKYNTAFHENLYKATRSNSFIETISGLLDRLHWLRAIALSASRSSLEPVEDHKQIFQALLNKDPAALENALRLHLEHARDKCVEMLDIIF
jgi:DNA-binding GntR family transcriptional regulator